MTNMPGASRPYADRLVALSLMCLLMVSMAWIKPGTTQAHTRKYATPIRLVQDEHIWVLKEPERNMLEKPRQKQVSSKQLIKGTALVGERSSELFAAPGPMVFVNQPPPEGFHFEFNMDAMPDMPSPAIPGGFGPGTVMDMEILREIASQRNVKSGQQRQVDIQIRERMEQSRNRIFHRKVETEAERIADEYRKAAETYGNRRYAPVPYPRAPRAAVKSPVLVQQEALPQLLLGDKDLIELAVKDDPELIQLMRKAAAPGFAQAAEAVKVNRIKTKQGYMLRIETGVESIDIRIGENDIIVENRRPE
jgi:hypothetical protein